MIELYRGAAAAEEKARGEAPATEPEARCRWRLFNWPCGAAEAEPASEADSQRSYARTATNELELLFPRLPNPDIYIYVTPHLATDERVPVPGYTTAVPLYERVEYALPGEAQGDPESGAESERLP